MKRKPKTKNKPETKKSLVKLSEKLSTTKGLAEFIQQPSVVIAETITGFLGSSLSDYKLATGKIIQGALKFRLLTQLGRVLKELREKGKIKEDYFATHKQQATFIEMLKFIDEEVPDEERFKAMKSIFLNTISKDASDEDELLGYELIKLCRQLNSGDILLLKYCYEEGRKDSGFRAINIASQWLKRVSEGLKLPVGIVELHEDNLMRLKLLLGRQHADKSGVYRNPDGRLTDSCRKLCKFITNELDKGNKE